MLSKLIFCLGYHFRRPKVLKYYKKYLKTQWDSSEKLRLRQDMQLKKMIKYVYKNTPYYYKLFNIINLKPDDISSVKDLEKIPVLTKDEIRKNYEDIIFRQNIRTKYIH